MESINNSASSNIGVNSYAAIVNNNGKQEIYVWGSNAVGQLGLGDTRNRDIPTLLESSSLGNYLSIKELTISTSNIMKVIVDTPEAKNQIYLCGFNSYGTFANGNTTNQSTPILFNTKQFGDFKEIKKLVFHNDSSSVDNVSSYIILSTDITSTDMGRDKIYVWGQNNAGQLGIGNQNNVLSGPRLFDTTQFGTYKNIKEFSLDLTSHAIIDVDGSAEKLFLWGYNDQGQCAVGFNNPNFIASPTQLSSSIFNNSKIKFIKQFEQRVMFMILTRNGVDELYGWGNNAFNQLGAADTSNKLSPYRIPQSSLGGATEIVSIRSDNSTTFAQVKVSGKLTPYVWGWNITGSLGNGNNNQLLTPTLSNSFANFTQVYESSFDPKYTGSYVAMFAYGSTSSGDKIYVWGSNYQGGLGVGNTTNQFSPVALNLPIFGAKKINFNNIGLTSMINVISGNNTSITYASGSNNAGELGIGNTTNVSSFTQTLPTRYTNPQPKVTPTPDLTSSQALELINPNNTLNRTELGKYVDTTSFPAGATLSIDPATTTSDYKNGILNLGIKTNQYNQLMIVNPVSTPKTFNVTIPGFRPVTDVNTNPVSVIIRDADGNNIDKIYDQLVDSTYKVINRDLLEYYFDLSSIPPNAVIHLYRTSFGNNTEATFTLTSSQVYGNNGLIVSNQLYVKTDLVWTFTSSQLNLALVISLSVVGGLLLIGAIIAIMLVRRSSNRLII